MRSRALTISLLPGARAATATRVTLSVEELTEALGKFQYRNEKDGGAWSPILWEDNERASDNAESVCALVYDLDDPSEADIDALGAKLFSLSWVYVIHETHSSTETQKKFRLVIPCERDMSPAEYPAVWEGVRALLNLRADPSCRDLARLFYLPARPEGAEPGEVEAGGSVLMTPLASAPPAPAPRESSPSVAPSVPLDLSPLRAGIARLPGEHKRALQEALDFKLRLAKGERENRLHALTCALVTVLPEGGNAASDWETVLKIFEPVVDSMEAVEDKGRDYYLGRVRFSFERSYERRERERRQREAARDYFRPDPDGPDAWRGRLIQMETKSGPRVKACTANVDLILEHDPAFRGHIRFDELRRRLEVTGGALAREQGSHAHALSVWLQRSEYAIDIAKESCGACLLGVARRHGYNPVAQYLESLVWDGTPRIGRLLLNYCEAEGAPRFIESVTRKFLISAAARALDPGVKVDTVLVLQGPQGTRKTSLVETLAGEWYTTVNTRIDDKDTKMQATGAWFVELSELATAAKSTIEQLRGFLTQRKDHIRLPYGEAIEEFPRRCVFMGTTNADQPLSDPEGNRRFWVISCGRIDYLGISRIRDQIWAEAVWCYRQYKAEEPTYHAGDVKEIDLQYRWWLTAEEQVEANRENEVFLAESPMEADIRLWLEKPGEKPLKMTSTEVARKVLQISAEKLSTDSTILPRVSRTLRVMGWKRIRTGSHRDRWWTWEVPRGPVDIDDESN